MAHRGIAPPCVKIRSERERLCEALFSDHFNFKELVEARQIDEIGPKGNKFEAKVESPFTNGYESCCITCTFNFVFYLLSLALELFNLCCVASRILRLSADMTGESPPLLLRELLELVLAKLFPSG